jgi:hypothetical protein
MPEVRVAGPADYQEVCRLLMLAHAENAIFKENPTKVDWYIRRCLWARNIPEQDIGPRGCFGVIGNVGALEAIVMLVISTMWYTDQSHLEEYLVFVDPTCRRGQARHGIALVNWAKAQSDRTGLPLLTGILSNHRTEGKCRLYRRLVPKVGEFFLYGHFASDELTGAGSNAVTLSSSVAA